MKTKSGLIKDYENGKLKDSGVMTLTNTSAVVVVDIDHDAEKVFGYITGGSKPIYFFTKIYTNAESVSYFKVNQLKVRFDHVMRI